MVHPWGVDSVKYAVAVIIVLSLSPAFAQSGRRSKQERKPQSKISELETPLATFRGTVKSIDKKEIVLELAEEKQEVAFHRSRKTKFLKDAKEVKPSDIPPGTPVAIEAKRDLLGNIDAVSVIVQAKAK
jgi:hypothetical protein